MRFPVQPRVVSLSTLACAALLCHPVHAQRKPPHPALSPWQQVLAARVSFETAPDKSRASFTAILDDFRAIYHSNPRDLHAAEAVNNVAQLLAEQGRTLDDPRSLRNAVAQYEFLRQQYPGSSLRSAALLEEAQIEDAELHDAKSAHAKYAQILKEAPRSAAAGEARVALAEQARMIQQAPGHRSSTASPESDNPAMRQATAELESPAEVIRTARTRIPPEPARTPEPTSAEAEPAHAPLALVSGIRHWSTPTYTRVAIDLGGEVTFQAARVPHPDRIYFDLHGAKLASQLTGKSFDVTDDGFLKRIRAAQDSSTVTRVVLDVSQVADYSAFLLPNPYRLIIDIHGAKPAAPELAEQVEPKNVPNPDPPVPANAVQKSSAAADSSGLPAFAPTRADQSASAAENPGNATTARNDRVPAPRTAVAAKATAARPVPNTVATQSPAATQEVAEVSHAPGRKEATPHPTSNPIASAPTGHSRLSRTRIAPVPDDEALPARAAARTASGETSLTRALGLGIGRIVIDAGHGGHDSGTLGVDGIEEKDVVLDVALRLGKLLHDRLGAEIIYTRSDDTFIPLETRTAIANKAQADLFLSIHANSSSDLTARGVETYYLNFTSDPSALDVAARENAVSGESIHQLSSLVKKIALKDKIDESREFASDVEGSLYTGLERGNGGLKDRGVKKAPFVVLIGANMPSILAEISFITNPRDATQLRQPDYRERVAESLFRGVAKYEQGLAESPPPTNAEARITTR